MAGRLARADGRAGWFATKTIMKLFGKCFCTSFLVGFLCDAISIWCCQYVIDNGHWHQRLRCRGALALYRYYRIRLFGRSWSIFVHRIEQVFLDQSESYSVGQRVIASQNGAKKRKNLSYAFILRQRQKRKWDCQQNVCCVRIFRNMDFTKWQLIY